MVYFYPFYIMKYKMHTEKSSRTQNNCPATHHRHPCDHRPAPEAHHPPKCVCRPAHPPRPPPAARPVPTPRLYSGLAFDLDLSIYRRVSGGVRPSLLGTGRASLLRRRGHVRGRRARVQVAGVWPPHCRPFPVALPFPLCCPLFTNFFFFFANFSLNRISILEV